MPPAVQMLPVERGAPQLHRFGWGQLAAFSAADPTAGERPCQDRAAVLLLDGGRVVLSVADGAGGHADGGEAAALALGALHEAVGRALETDGGELRFGVLEGFEMANRRVLELGNGAATTLATAMIEGRTMRSCHVGDSMVLVVGQRGRVRMQTVAHSPVGYALEAGVIDAEEAMHHEDRHVVSNMIGTADMHIDMRSPLPLQKRDTVLVACDGLYDNLQIEEIVETVRAGPLLKAAERLAEAAIARMTRAREGQASKPDDLTFVLFRLLGEKRVS